MEKIEFAIAEFKYSKSDLYVVEIIKRFESYKQALDVFIEKNYDNLAGGTWQDAYEYRIIDIKDGNLYYHDGGKIVTVLD